MQMSNIQAIFWFIGLLLAIQAIRVTFGWAGLVAMFPEGKRWWMFPVQILSLVFFAVIIRLNPFWV